MWGGLRSFAPVDYRRSGRVIKPPDKNSYVPTNRIALVGLQAIGALSLIPYPFVILANVMSIAAPGQTLFGAIPYILLSIYPVVWIALYVLAWRAISSGATGLAFALSSVPLLVCLFGVCLYLNGVRSVSTYYSKAASDARAHVEPLNPLLWTILCVGGPTRLPGGPPVSVDQALKAIDANPTLVNLPVPPYGTPLKNALLNLAENIDGTLGNDRREPPGRQQDLVRIVRSLVAHGAHLGPDEKTDIWRSWQLRRAMFDGPVTTSTENPLVWRILKWNQAAGEQFKIAKEDLPFINVPTKLHGTPLYAALVMNGYYIFPDLVKAGARLSPSEEKDPAATKALAEMLEKRPEVRTIYK